MWPFKKEKKSTEVYLEITINLKDKSWVRKRELIGWTNTDKHALYEACKCLQDKLNKDFKNNKFIVRSYGIFKCEEVTHIHYKIVGKDNW
jgi:hypothetical protein